MAPADEARALPGIDQRAGVAKGLRACRDQGGPRAFVERRLRRHVGADVGDQGNDIGRPPEALAALHARVEGGDCAGDALGKRVVQRTARGDAVEQPLLIEALHHDDPVHRRPRPVDRQPFSLTRHPGGPEVELRRRAAVDPQFGGAGTFAQRQRREVHEGKLHGALQLVRAVAGEKHHRAVGVDALDAVDAPGARIGQERRDLALVFDDHPAPQCAATLGRTSSTPSGS